MVFFYGLICLIWLKNLICSSIYPHMPYMVQKILYVLLIYPHMP